MFKSRSSKFFFVHPKLLKICTQSVSLVVYYMIQIIIYQFSMFKSLDSIALVVAICM